MSAGSTRGDPWTRLLTASQEEERLLGCESSFLGGWRYPSQVSFGQVALARGDQLFGLEGGQVLERPNAIAVEACPGCCHATDPSEATHLDHIRKDIRCQACLLSKVENGDRIGKSHPAAGRCG